VSEIKFKLKEAVFKNYLSELKNKENPTMVPSLHIIHWNIKKGIHQRNILEFKELAK